MGITIINLTPHPVTIIRHGLATPGMLALEGATITGESIPDPHGSPADRLEMTRIVFPACDQARLPRATEKSMDGAGCMELAVSGDTQDAYSNHWSMVHTGVVDFVGYSGVENLPDLSPDERAFGCTTFRIVSIVTAIGALAAGRPIVDLLVPMGQVRDAGGRIIGATSLAPASALLTPMAERIKGWSDETRRLLVERSDALREAQQTIADLTSVREAQDARIMQQQRDLVEATRS